MSKATEQIWEEYTNGHKANHTFTAAELMAMEIPPVEYAIPDVLPSGVTLLAGKVKHGKSWMALGFGIAVATGGVALGTKPVEAGDCLYLALEDNKRRLQKRLRKLLVDGSGPERLHLEVEWPRADEGGIEALDKWLTDHPECRLVIIDTLARFKPRTSGKRTQYDEERDSVDPLAPLADRHNVAIVLVHHLRESESDDPLDMIHGSAGLTGGVDGALVLKRKRGDADAYLTVDGRDIEEHTELALRWHQDAATWAIMGDAEEYRLIGERREIVRVLRESYPEPLGAKDTAIAIGKGDPKGYNATRQRLYQMSQSGEVKTAGRGKYSLPNKPNNPNNTNNPNNPNKRDPDARDVRDVRTDPNNDSLLDAAEESHSERNVRDVRDVRESPSKGRLTSEQVERVKRLMASGMSAKNARAEVLGEDPFG
jgi:hypothetical protein